MECTPIPCPSFTTVELTVDAVCDCFGHPGYGNPHCPIHGEQVVAAELKYHEVTVQAEEAGW